MVLMRYPLLLEELCSAIAEHARAEIPVTIDAVAGLEARGKAHILHPMPEWIHGVNFWEKTLLSGYFITPFCFALFSGVSLASWSS